MKEKKCKECGKIFVPRCGTQIYCEGPHIANCVICGAEFSYTCRPTERAKTCSKECQKSLKEQTVMREHGVKNVSELQWVRDKISAANTDEVKAKRAATSLLHTGYDNPAKSPEVRAKMSEVMKTDTYLNKRGATCLTKYGTWSPMQNESVKAKQKATNRKNHGMDGHPHTREDYMKMMIDPSKVDNYLLFKADPATYISEHYTHLPIISELEHDLGVTNTPIYDILIDSGCRDMLATTYSTMEDEVVSYIQSLDETIIIERNNRTIIKPYELDIYLPEYSIAFECNPVATHNSSFVDPWGSAPKSYDYHQMKSRLSQDAGIFLFHIFGYEWNNKKNIIKSMISNLLHTNVEKIGARNTEVVTLDFNECKQFLDANHRQGNANSPIRLGLKDIHTHELVAVMTFGKLRATLGQSKDGCEYELVRFCSKTYTNVLGGAAKLFSYFVTTYHPESIVSFSDVAHTRGKLYEILHFNSKYTTLPSYVWVDLYDQVYYHRTACQKQHLQKLFNDETIDIDNLTESEIMKSHKFAQVFDSGVIKWVWNAQ